MEPDRQPVLPGTPSSFQPSTADLQPPEVPDHELLRLIGRGSFGEVWMARNAIGTMRAVKIIHRSRFTRPEDFAREFKGLLKFEPISRSHDGLVDVLQIGRRDDAGYFFYVMELADGVPDPNEEGQNPKEDRSSSAEEATGKPGWDSGLRPPSIFEIRHSSFYAPHTLRSELQVRGRLAPDQCVAIGRKLAAALEHLHASRLVHRDIKPSNIIFVGGEPKLADIGLVTGIDEAHSMVGTLGYIPPEGPGKALADVYSLGKVLYEISLGKDRHEFPQLPPDLQTLPEYAALLELNEVVLKACESDPRKRYQSAAEMATDLQLLQLGKSVKRKRTRERHWAVGMKLGLAGAAVALLIGALLLVNGSKHGYTPKPEAAREYELGRWYFNQLTPESHKKAIEHLSQAVQLDPKFVLPYRELTALCVWAKPGLFAGEEERIRQLKAIADKLLALDSSLAEGHVALSWWKFTQQDWRGAEDEIVRAIRLNPHYSFARDIYACYLSLLGRPDEALRQAQRSQELDPTARTSAMMAAWPFMAARQFDKAIVQLKRVIELDKNFPEAHNYLGQCYEAQSNYVAAIEAWRAYDLLVGHDPARVTSSYDALRQAYDTGGEQGYLRKYIELIRENESLPKAEQIFFAHDAAGYYARLGQNEKALDEIEKHLDPLRVLLKFEPMFDTLHDEPRFKALLKKVGLEK